MPAAAARAGSVGWHVSPSIDLLGYSFAWIFIVPPALLLLGKDSPHGSSIFILTTLITDLHRHYTLPYVYLDGSVRERFPIRFWLLPAVFLALLSQTPAIARSFTLLSVTDVLAGTAWLVWLVQLVRQDRGGTFQTRATLPVFLGAVLAGSVASAATEPGYDLGLVWLALAGAGSVGLHVLVVRDGDADPHGGRRTTLLFPAVISALVGVGALVGREVPTAITLRTVTNAVLITFLLWHVYHVLMQKYGILRIYSAKSGRTDKVPGWVDRALVWCIVPAVFVWAGGTEVEQIAERLGQESSGLDGMAAPFLRLLGAHFGVLMALSTGLVVASAGAFLYYEWKVHRLSSWPRLAYALGTLLFYATFFELGLGAFYSCFAFAHGIEYMVFIWAFQRRRYAEGAAGQQARSLVRLLQRPLVFYATYTGALAAFLFYCRYGERFIWLDSESVYMLGETPWEWIRWYTVYQGILHFYYDGFLWKLRRPELRAQM